MIDTDAERSLAPPGALTVLRLRAAYRVAALACASAEHTTLAPTSREVRDVLASHGVCVECEDVRVVAYAAGLRLADGIVDPPRSIRLVPPVARWR